MDSLQLVAGLRKIAQDLREESKQVEAQKMEKCAYVVLAAHGLNRLRSIIQHTGGTHE